MEFRNAVILISLMGAPALQAQEKPANLENQSEAGIVIAKGNSDSESISLRHESKYTWDQNLGLLKASFLRTRASQVESAKNYTIGLRYERALSDKLSLFLAETFDSNEFAGFDAKYSTDIGLKYILQKTDDVTFYTEAGYRYTYEDRIANTALKSHSLRLFAEYLYAFTSTSSLRGNVEYLPNVSDSEDYQLNAEVALAATLSDKFSLKSGYLVKFDNVPSAAKKTDSLFMTSLIAKY